MRLRLNFIKRLFILIIKNNEAKRRRLSVIINLTCYALVRRRQQHMWFETRIQMCNIGTYILLLLLFKSWTSVTSEFEQCFLMYTRVFEACDVFFIFVYVCVSASSLKLQIITGDGGLGRPSAWRVWAIPEIAYFIYIYVQYTYIMHMRSVVHAALYYDIITI